MTFAAFLVKYYPPEQEEDVARTLNNLGIYCDIAASLNDFYQAAASGSKNEIITQFVLTGREVAEALYHPLIGMGNGEHGAGIRQQMATLAVYLIRDTCTVSGLDPAAYFDLLVQTLRKTYAKYIPAYTALEKRLNPGYLQALAFAGHKVPAPDTAAVSKPVTLGWQGEKHLDFFVDDLAKTFKGARKHFYHLFDLIKTDFEIELSSKYLIPFLSLFYRLHQSGVIKVQGNRGLFVYLRQHLRAPVKDMYPKRDFRKLRHEAEQNEKINSVNYQLIKPLLEKYCGNGR